MENDIKCFSCEDSVKNYVTINKLIVCKYCLTIMVLGTLSIKKNNYSEYNKNVINAVNELKNKPEFTIDIKSV